VSLPGIEIKEEVSGLDGRMLPDDGGPARRGSVEACDVLDCVVDDAVAEVASSESRVRMQPGMISLPIACAVCAEPVVLPVLAATGMARMLVVTLLTSRHLDTVRVLLVFGGLSIVWYVYQRTLLWHWPSRDNPIAQLCLVFVQLSYSTGILAAMMIKWLSTSRLFQKGSLRLRWRQAFLLVPIWILILVCEIMWIEYRRGPYRF